MRSSLLSTKHESESYVVGNVVEAQVGRVVTTKSNIQINKDSPISILPPELLAEIFSFCGEIVIGRFRYVHIPGLTISAVSRLWKETVFSTPSVWAEIVIHAQPLPRLTTRDLEAEHGLYITPDRLLELSGSHPLNLSFITDEACSYGGPILSSLTPHIQRCGKLSLEHHVPRSDSLLEKLLDLPNLKSLDIVENTRCRATETSDKKTLVAPMLQRLTIRWRSVSLILPFNQITHLAYVGVECIKDLIRALRACPQLLSLEIAAVYAWCSEHRPDSFNSAAHRVLLPRLVSLAVTAETAQSCDIFRFLSTPDLQSLTLRGRYSKPPSPMEEVSRTTWIQLTTFSEFISRSSCKVTSFELDSVLPAFPDRSVEQFHLLFPDLQSLVLREPPEGYALVSLFLLTLGDSSRLLLPSLKILHLDIPLDVKTVLNLLQARCDVGAVLCLERITVRTPLVPSEADVERIAALRRAGLRVYV